jgi:hypothetical protein
VVKVGVPDVRGTTAPPSIEEMSPTAGPAGAELSFSGSNVKDRRVTVTVNDEVLVDTEHALANTFTATLPDDLGTGMYEVKTDVAALFRRSFLFEVKPDE